MKGKKFKVHNPPHFLYSLYEILEKAEYSKIIKWDKNGESFTIHDVGNFTNQILQLYFKHKNYNSFIRQLNIYDFKKSKSINNNVYSNKYFKRGKKNLIGKIKRKTIFQKDCQSQLEKNETEKSFKNISTAFYEKMDDINLKQESVEQRLSNLMKENETYKIKNNQLIQKISTESKNAYSLQKFMKSIVDYLISIKLNSNDYIQLDISPEPHKWPKEMTQLLEKYKREEDSLSKFSNPTSERRFSNMSQLKNFQEQNTIGANASFNIDSLKNPQDFAKPHDNIRRTSLALSGLFDEEDQNKIAEIQGIQPSLTGSYYSSNIKSFLEKRPSKIFSVGSTSNSDLLNLKRNSIQNINQLIDTRIGAYRPRSKYKKI